MASGPDSVTLWWRRISLRAKVTGVTVAVLALGLVIAGIGTVPILRGAMINNINAQLPALASTGQAERFFDVSSNDGQLVFEPASDAPRATDFVVAFYNSTDGSPIAQAGGQSADRRPVFPATFTLQAAKAKEDQVLPLATAEGLSYNGAVTVLPSESAQGFTYIQVVALPLAEADRIVGTYFAVYTTVALVTILLAALLIRGLVTLTFRRLGQVESTAMAIASGDFSQRLTDLEPTTEVGRLNTAINTMLDRVDRSLAQRDRTVRNMRRFIGDASHELRTPLVSVRGYAELYRMGAIHGEEDTARAMERIEKEAIRMGVLVEDLLALARLDEERERQLQITPLDLRPIARDAALDVRVASPGRKITVIDTTADALGDDAEPPTARRPQPPAAPTASARTGALARLRRRSRPTGPGTSTESIPAIDFTEATDAPVRTPPIVLGEDNKVRQVVTNLLGNARRFSPVEGPIEIVVGVDRRRGVGTIAVVDHGEGIPPQIREHIFERFWRADTSRARETGGAGLGLAIVASIVETLEGSVRVDETPGGGATFTVSLPLAPARSTPAHLLEETQPIDRLDI
ncbi:Signal transduction histidine kinase [Microbacterium esteraromaticum]|uniref:histidine kinase n=1 Tax=Microbacterium esteraromaticum TaxID=57043 RepID=A0A1R4I688_9MICO|nr:HAMP domain-containing sensor histidine kinase [Microbacterium esteraromaticum]SJN15298.1 Signal transduction histidine kinase [Microbacterium esteraromaticum]